MNKLKYNLKIKDLKKENRPREKLINYGLSNLNNTELLAIILSTGTRKEDLYSMSSRLINQYGEKIILKEKNPLKISREFNVPLNKACQIIACFELGKRFLDNNKNNDIYLYKAKDVYNYLKEMRDLKKENLRGLYLNNSYKLIHDELISLGTLNSSLVHPREVFQPAIYHSAAALIIAHNHPSGQLKPSQNDIKITKKLKKSGIMLEIELLDHLIITEHGYISII